MRVMKDKKIYLTVLYCCRVCHKKAIGIAVFRGKLTTELVCLNCGSVNVVASRTINKWFEIEIPRIITNYDEQTIL
jgi:hypothetical protein